MNFDFNMFLRRKGLKQQEAADRLGVTQATISNWCKGKTPDYGTIVELIKQGMTMQELFGEEVAALLVKNSSGTLPPQEILNNAVFRGGMEDIVMEVLKAKGVIPK